MRAGGSGDDTGADQDRRACQCHRKPTESIDENSDYRREGVHAKNVNADHQPDDLQGRMPHIHVHRSHDHHHHHHQVTNGNHDNSQDRLWSCTQMGNAVSHSRFCPGNTGCSPTMHRYQVGIRAQEHHEDQGGKGQRDRGDHVRAGQWF